MRILRVVLVIMVVAAVGCGRKPEEHGEPGEVEKTVAKKREPGPVFAGEVTRFEQISHYQDGQMDGYAFYVRDPNMKDIESFCVEKQVELCRKNKSLKMYFFDNREKTPDISKEFVFGRASDDHCVADYSFMSQIGLSEMTWHKKMME